MIPELRTKFNSEFTDEKYKAFVNDLSNFLKYPVDFRVSETPLFLSDNLKSKLLNASADLSRQVIYPDFKVKMKDAVPAHLIIPGETDHPQFFVCCGPSETRLEYGKFYKVIGRKNKDNRW